jgi:hypothetical protein
MASDLLKSLAGDRVKTGAIYTTNHGMEASTAVEVVQLDSGLSLDLGLTKTQGFIGVSKDVLKFDRLEVDIGAGVTTKKAGYFGIHARF